jgi:acyl carrier protein
MNEATSIHNALREWIATASTNAGAIEITDSTAIIEQRIITSVQVMDLILFIQELSGKPIQVEDLKAGAFRDVNTIYKTFFEDNHES